MRRAKGNTTAGFTRAVVEIVGCLRGMWQEEVMETTTVATLREQVVTQLLHEVITLKAEVADQTGLAESVRAINRNRLSSERHSESH